MVSMSPTRSLPRASVLSIALVSLLACSSQDSQISADPGLSAAVSPAGEETSAASQFPLAVGNEWTYEGHFSIRDENSDPADAFTIPRTEVHVVTGTEERSGRIYQLLEQRIDEGEFGVTTQWERLRQLRSGLYQLDVSINEPPMDVVALAAETMRTNRQWSQFAAAVPEAQRAAYRRAWDEINLKRELIRGAMRVSARPGGGPATDEITRLVYPLHTGASWVIRDEPFLMTARVVGREVRDVPVGREPAWLVRIEAEFFSPDDRAYFWYGKSGLVEQSVHLIVVTTDASGQHIATLISDDVMVLTSMSR